MGTFLLRKYVPARLLGSVPAPYMCQPKPGLIRTSLIACFELIRSSSQSPLFRSYKSNIFTWDEFMDWNVVLRWRPRVLSCLGPIPRSFLDGIGIEL